MIHSSDGRRVEHELAGNPEVPATEVDPTTLDFSPDGGSWLPLHAPGSVRSDSEVSSTLLDGLQDDSGMASTQLSPHSASHPKRCGGGSFPTSPHQLHSTVKVSFRSEPSPPPPRKNGRFWHRFFVEFFLFFFPKKKTVDFGTIDLPECQEQPPLPKKKITVDFGTVDLPNVKNTPPPPKKNGRFWHR